MTAVSTNKSNNPLNFGGTTTLSLMVTSRAVKQFFSLLQKGVCIHVALGCTIKGFLEDQLGLPPEYCERRIQTIFLDAKAVDHPDQAVLRDGCTLTLSAAMPGILGQMLRKASACAALRSEITHREDLHVPPSGRGIVMVRLFNFLATEVGPILLEKGVWVRGEDLEVLLGKDAGLLREDAKKVVLNGETVNVKKMTETPWSGIRVFLEVSST